GGLFRIGVVAVAVPMSEPAGHLAGLVANWASVQAFWSVTSREGSAAGSCVSTFRMSASPRFCPTLTSSDAPWRLPLPAVVAEKDGLNERLAQLAAWKRLEAASATPRTGLNVASTDIGAQLVGLSMKPDRSIITLTCRTLRVMPCSICGSGSEAIVTCAVCGSM